MSGVLCYWSAPGGRRTGWPTELPEYSIKIPDIGAEVCSISAPDDGLLTTDQFLTGTVIPVISAFCGPPSTKKPGWGQYSRPGLIRNSSSGLVLPDDEPDEHRDDGAGKSTEDKADHNALAAACFVIRYGNERRGILDICSPCIVQGACITILPGCGCASRGI